MFVTLSIVLFSFVTDYGFSEKHLLGLETSNSQIFLGPSPERQKEVQFIDC